MSSSCIDATKRRCLIRSSAHTTAGSAAGPSIVRAAHRNEASQALPASSEPEGKDVFQEINRHLLIVFDAAAALVGVGTRSKASVTGIAPPRANQVTIPRRNQCGASAPRCFDFQFFVVIVALLIVLSVGSFGGLSLYRYFSKPNELSGKAAVSALVERIIAVESNGDPNAKNNRSSALGLGQFLDETWLDLVRAYRPDLTRSRSASETLELRREPKLAREIIMRFVARNITMLRQRRLPVTAGTVYLAHFAGGAGAVAILPAPDNFDAALVIVNADSTGRTKRERLTKTNPFLEHFTVADLKSWAERKMRGPNLRLAEADSKP
jgi:Transglycosylase SLT domain